MCEASSPLIHLPDQQDNQGESLELKGYLFKKGRTTRRSWKRRYFLLKRYTREHALLSEEKTESTEWVLEYFSDEEKSNQPCKLKRKMPLKGAEVFIPREISLQNNRVHEFSVTPGTGQFSGITLHLYSEEESVMKLWVDALDLAIQMSDFTTIHPS